MTKKEFKAQVLMIVELEDEFGSRHRATMHESEVEGYIEKMKNNGYYFSDLDYSGTQDNPEIKQLLDKAWEILIKDKKYDNLDDAIDSLLEDDTPKVPAKKVWTEDEIKSLVQTNDKVLYGALRKLYAEQTADEQRAGATKFHNGVGFNGADSRFLSSVAEFLNRRGYLTDKQKVVTRKKLVKYTKQLTRLANAG